MPSLGDYKYYDLSNGNKTELIKDIINAINAQNQTAIFDITNQL